MFIYQDYAELAIRLRILAQLEQNAALAETLSNNLAIIIAALDIASNVDERVTRLMVGIDECEFRL